MNPKLEKYIATRDKKMKMPTSSTPLLDQFKELEQRRRVEVGGRASCGSGVDPTWKFFTAWNEIVRKAQSLGYEISFEGVKHANGSPTRSGGFWNSNIYVLAD
jgi:hypothetical protein